MFFYVRASIIFAIISISFSIPSFAATNVSSSISQDTTWSIDGSPYIVDGSVIVEEGVTLTIEPGARVEFNAGLGMEINGQLSARGDAQNLIYFTSASANPELGDWGSIEFTKTAANAKFDVSDGFSGSIIAHAVVEYGDCAVDVNEKAPFISNVTLRYNKGAIGCYQTQMTIHKSLFYQNSGGYGAISASSSATKSCDLTITECTFSENNGGTISASFIDKPCALTITECKFTENTAHSGGAIGLYSPYRNFAYLRATNRFTLSLTLNKCLFSKNSAKERGGAINYWHLDYEDPMEKYYPGYEKPYSAPYYLSITDCYFTGNSAREGGAAYISSSPEPVFYSEIIDNSTFIKNTAVLDGGAVLSNELITVKNSNFIGNSAGRYGSAIYSGNLTMNNSLIANNIGGVAIWSGWYSGGIRIEGCTIANNIPDVGTNELQKNGGIFATSNLYITNSNIFGNQDYNLMNYSTGSIDATQNYWGTTVESTIDLGIFDMLDDNTKGRVSYDPFLTEFAPGPMPPDNTDPDIDIDNDGYINDIDNCPLTSNFDQADSDGDGIGDVCDNGENDDDRDGYTIDQGDCDDSDASVYPGASEICEDGVDQDCDGTDESCETTDEDEPTGSDNDDDTCFISIMH